MTDDWFQASLDGDDEGAAKIQERVAREASLKVATSLRNSYDPGLEALLPDTRTVVPRDRFYDAFLRLESVMSIECESVQREKNLVQGYGGWQAALASQMGRENWAMSEGDHE